MSLIQGEQWMQRRLLPLPIFHIDTNRINARGKIEAMNQLEKWKKNGVILISMSGVSFKEAHAGINRARIRKTFEQIFTTTEGSINKNNPKYMTIETALFPNGVKDQNQESDVKIVYEASYYKATLVTNDGDSRGQPKGILGIRVTLREIVQIMTDVEAVNFIKRKIAERDYRTRVDAMESGDPLPSWVGED
jgi:hypothetical protein